MRAIFDKGVLLAAALLVKLVFTIYQAFAWLLLLAIPAFLVWLAFLAARDSRWAVAAASLVPLAAYALYHYADGKLPRSVGAGGWIDRIGDRFIAWIGTLKFFTSPFSLVEDPGSYKIKGTDIRLLTDGETPLLQPGDILLRGYDGYVDGELIRRTGGAKGAGKYFSHAALYVGELNAGHDKEITARRLQVMDDDGTWRPATDAEKDRVRNDPAYFQPGRQVVIHSMAKGVHVEDILTFVRCDYLVVLRLPDLLRLAPNDAANSPLVELTDAAFAIDSCLLRGDTASRDAAVAAARDTALGRIGSGYDFQFDNCRTFHRFSCSEFVYYCYKGVQRYIGLKPKKHAFAGLFARSTVSPTDIYEAADPDAKLRVVWKNVPSEK